MNDLTAIWLIYRHQLRGSLRSVRTWICALLCLAPLGIAVSAGGRADALDLAGGVGAMLLLQVVAPLVGLVCGSAVVTEEVEARTITYIFTRPVSRTALFLGRWLASSTVVVVLLVGAAFALTWVSVAQPVQLRGPRNTVQIEVEKTMTEGWRVDEPARARRGFRYEREDGSREWVFVGHLQEGEVMQLEPDSRGRARRAVGMGPLPVSTDLPDFFLLRLSWAAVLGGLFYTLVTAGLGIFLKRPVIVGLGYAFAMEGVLANIPGSTQALSVQYHLRSILVDPTVDFWGRFEPFENSEFVTWLPSTLRMILLLGVTVAVCAWAIRRRQFVLTS